MPIGSLVTGTLAGLVASETRAAHTLRLVVAASLGIIAIALGFEYIGKYHPCPLCLMERYAYYFAIVAGAAGLAAQRAGHGGGWLRLLLAAIAIGYLINAGLGAHHAGVEWKWWAGPDTCTAPLPKLTGGTGLDLSQPVIRCDEAPWRFAGLSFAGWNAVLSALLAILAAWGLGKGSGKSGDGG